MTIRLAAVVAVALLAACSNEQPAPTQETVVPTESAEPAQEPVADPTEEPPRYDDEVDFAARDIEGEPATAGLIAAIEDATLPDGAIRVINASMIRYKEVYYVVAAVAETPDGVQILTYLHAPWDQSDIDGSGITEPLNFAAQQWKPLAAPSTDEEAYEIGEQLIVDRP